MSIRQIVEVVAFEFFQAQHTDVSKFKNRLRRKLLLDAELPLLTVGRESVGVEKLQAVPYLSERTRRAPKRGHQAIGERVRNRRSGSGASVVRSDERRTRAEGRNTSKKTKDVCHRAIEEGIPSTYHCFVGTRGRRSRSAAESCWCRDFLHSVKDRSPRRIVCRPADCIQGP